MIYGETRALLVLVLSAALGCGTMTSGSTQSLPLTTQPPDAKVSFFALTGAAVAEGEARAGEMTLPRPKNLMPYVSVVSREGYCPAYEITKVNPTPGYMSEAVLLAIPFIQVIGFVMMSVDHSTGGCCAVEPVVVELKEGSTCD